MLFSLAFSPCPNDTFIFDALVNKKIDTEGIDFDVHLEDVQTLNEWAIADKMDISKISYGVLPIIINNYELLNSGGALGKGVGPLLVTKKDFKWTIEKSIAIPGINTTAHLLFMLAFPDAKNKVFKVFNEIEDAVLSGEVDAGVIIHENRFTYEEKGLTKQVDLGAYWEEKLNIPIPLGGIVIKKNINQNIATKIEGLIRKSIEYAFKHYPFISDYVKLHSQEMNEEVMRKHINLYVNEYSLNLGNDGIAAINKLISISKMINS